MTHTVHMNDKPTLHFFCGKAGSGKTTVASRLAQDHNAVLISEDIWLARLFGDQMQSFDDYIRVSRKLKAAVGPLVVDLLTVGQSVVLDFQANTRAGRGWFRSLFEQAGAGHVLHVLDTPDQACLARIARRNVERPEGSHHLTEEDFMHVSSYFQAPEEAEGFKLEIHST
ncbi:MAG: ATP-binding protein [Nevskiales bacterium]|nr:ATP-binding protein [Nevskiales bacterium]